ncbi:ammonia-forming cytochrome c nitrite reductase subunit c552 [Gleimia hominis]|uniref:ammonia-forming cytochrome c nitrite reductase subunit c552 n=1 Tax=Gleimia hominis TaxID=595468 RepID=UPI0018EC9A03|nr:ammonia-forming cytochrome c nitrite reductase subunit c552 [Gleimia hominis]WIK63788.1 ammonia-forming cytochrome c nitrite reductase subunit c552 [Gleimia hominis]
MSNTNKLPHRRILVLSVAIVVTALITMSITALLINILERKNEGSDKFTKVVELTEDTVDPAVWGQNFPIQYEQTLKTKEMTPTVYGGSTKVAHKPTDKDPRTFVSSSRVEEDPRLKVMWDGYPFAVDYRHARGHEYMLEDQRLTRRVTEFEQPGACLNCHASTPTIMRKLGDGDVNKGFAKMNKMPYNEVTKLAEHPVSCLDCHDPKTMNLRVTRPAFINGIKALKAGEGVKDYDPNRDATRQEMRSFVCGQCHVEYYFKGKEEKTLTFPWNNGLNIDDIWQYYKENPHVDFVHAGTGAKILKAQHPEFDIWSNSIHADNGVSCSDCHMPYERNGAKKTSNHQLQSPLLNINASCMTCHKSTEEEMKNRVVNIQDRFIHSRDQAFDSLTQFVHKLEAAIKDGTATQEQIEQAREYQNKASFYLDYVYSENSYGFHAPAYIHRIIQDSLDASRKGMLVLDGAKPDQLGPSDITNNNTKEIKQRGH